MSVDRDVLFSAIDRGDGESVARQLATIPAEQIDDATCDGFETALMRACEHGQLDVARWLVARGASPTYSIRFWDNTALKALMRAPQESLELLQLLLDAIGSNAAASEINNDGDPYSDMPEAGDGLTPVMLAAQTGKAASLRYLLQQGGDPSLQDWRALKLAEAAGHDACVRLLETLRCS